MGRLLLRTSSLVARPVAQASSFLTGSLGDTFADGDDTHWQVLRPDLRANASDAGVRALLVFISCAATSIVPST